MDNMLILHSKCDQNVLSKNSLSKWTGPHNVPKMLSLVSRYPRPQCEGIPQVKEALEICEQLNDVSGQAHSLHYLVRLLHSDDQLGAAEVAASRAIDLLPEKGKQLLICKSHRLLWYTSLQRRNEGGHWPLRDSPRDRVLFQLEQPTILDPLFPGIAVLQRSQVRQHAHLCQTGQVACDQQSIPFGSRDAAAGTGGEGSLTQ